MKCEKCGCSVNEQPFMRMNEKGVLGIWWCHPCSEKYEPELFKNQMEEQSDVEKTLIDLIYKK